MTASIKVQIEIMFHKREFKIAMLISLGFTCFAFFNAIKMNWGIDASEMWDATQNLCYGVGNPSYSMLIFLFPFLIVIPYASSYIDDYRNQLLPVYAIRSSRMKYVSKLIACFIGTSLVIAIPFLFNFLLMNLFFPHSRCLLPGGYPDSVFCQNVLGIGSVYKSNYPVMSFLGLFLDNQILYSLLYLVIISIFAGWMGTFVLGLSFIWKYSKLFLFLPVFVLFQVLSTLNNYLFDRAVENETFYTNIDIMSYVLPIQYNNQSPYFFAGFLLVTAIIIIITTVYAVKHDLESIQ